MGGSLNSPYARGGRESVQELDLANLPQGGGRASTISDSHYIINQVSGKAGNEKK